MPFVSRDAKGNINAIYNQQTSSAHEIVSINDPELISFLVNAQQAEGELPTGDQDIFNLRISDLGLIRVLEDLIEVLIKKDIIAISDLPKMAVKRLQQRKVMREKLAPISQMMSGEKKDTNVLNPKTWLDED